MHLLTRLGGKIMSNVLLSIIIPCYNSEKTIERLVHSIGYNKDCEIIIINDGSKDNTSNVVKDLIQKYDNIIFIDKKNSGVSNTRNRGIDEAKGNWICFADSDDYYEKDFLQIILPLLKDCKYDSINYGYKMIYQNNKEQIGKPYMKDEILEVKDGFKDFLNLDGILKRINWGPCTHVYKTDIIKDNNIRFNESKKIGEDLLFNAEYFSYCKNAKCINKVLYNYYQSDNSLTRSGYNKTLYNEIKEYNDCYIKIMKKLNKENYEKFICNFYISQLFTLLINESLSKNKSKSKEIINCYISNDILKNANILCMKPKVFINYLIIKTRLAFVVFDVLYLKNSR